MKKAKSLQRIEAAFFELGRTMTADEISVQKLTETAGVARSTFYTYFEDKDDLTHRMENEILRPMEEIIKGIKNGNGRERFVRLLEYTRDHAGEILLLRYAKDSTLLKKLTELLNRELNRQQRQHHFACSEYQRFFLISALESVMVPTPLCPESTAEEMAEQIHKHFLHVLYPGGDAEIRQA